MAYERAREHLADDPSPSVLCLPDGSIDRHVTVHDSRGERLETRAAFGERVAAGSLRSVRLEERATHPGGQAVNAARQAHALGATTTLFGHLDHPVLDLPFETFSMGAPAEVTVCRFDRTVLMLSRESAALAEWSFDRLPGVFPDRLADADAVCMANWVGVGGMTEAIRDLAAPAPACPVVLDPGDLTGADETARASLAEALATLDGACPVVVSANGLELRALAGTLAVDADGSPAHERALREALDVAGVVRHDEVEAVAATDGRFGSGRSTARVRNFDAGGIERRAGAGDRFSGALATALGSGLDVPAALAIGNAAATHFVSQGETTTREGLAAFLDERADPTTE
jgi:sugar/nucleoside kinase (ribokinase family)